MNWKFKLILRCVFSVLLFIASFKSLELILHVDTFDLPFWKITLAFCSICGCSLQTSYIITQYMLVPEYAWNEFYIMPYNNRWSHLENKVGKANANKIVTTLNIMFGIFSILLFYSLTTYIKEVDKKELSKNGVKVNGVVLEIKKSQKGFNLGVIKYSVNNEHYFKEVPLNNHNLNDTITITCLNQNPHIVQDLNYPIVELK